MKKTLKTIAFFLLLLMFNSSFGQNSTLAKAYYTKAREAFEKNNYQETIDFLNKSKVELGSTNPDITFLEITSRFNLDKKDVLIASLSDEFLQTANKSDTKRIQQVSLMVVEHREVVAKAIKDEEDAYQNAVTTADVVAIRSFINNYPASTKNVLLQDFLVKIEGEYYNDATYSKKIEKYEKYLKFFPEGKYKAEISKDLAIAYEEKDFGLVKENKSEQSALQYLAKYPNGKFVTEVKDILEETLFTEGNTYYENDNLSEAKAKYESYKTNLPNGKNISKVEDKLISIDKKNKRNEAIENRTSAYYFMLTGTTDEAYGFELGRVSLKGVSTYFNMSGNKNVLNLQLEGAENEVDSADKAPKDYENAFLTASFGLTFKIAYPVWFYAGGGVKYQEFYSKDKNGDDVFFKIKDQKSTLFYPEAGLKLKIAKAIVLKGGAQYIGDEIIYQFGIGIQTKNWK